MRTTQALESWQAQVWVHHFVTGELTPGTQLWTRDKRLLAAAVRLGLAYAAVH